LPETLDFSKKQITISIYSENSILQMSRTKLVSETHSCLLFRKRQDFSLGLIGQFGSD